VLPSRDLPGDVIGSILTDRGIFQPGRPKRGEDVTIGNHSSYGPTLAVVRASQNPAQGGNLVPTSCLNCLCDTHLQPVDMPIYHSPVDAVPVAKARRRCTSGWRHRHLRFLPNSGSPNSLTKKHLMDVGALSCRIMFQSVSASLQNGLCFFHPPKPAYRSARLAARFPIHNTKNRRYTGFPRSA